MILGPDGKPLAVDPCPLEPPGAAKDRERFLEWWRTFGKSAMREANVVLSIDGIKAKS